MIIIILIEILKCDKPIAICSDHSGFEAKETVSETKSTRRNKKEEAPVEESVEEPQEVELEEANDDSFEL